MNEYELQYKLLLNLITNHGSETETRAGKAKMLFSRSIAADLRKGFPIITGKQIFFEKALAEWRWMWNGDTNIKFLNEHGIKWWDSYADDKGWLGRVYGYQIREFGGAFDQIPFVVEEIANNSRRAIITFWNPNDLGAQALPPCYTSMTFVREGNILHCDFLLRSSDVALGLPYDVVIGALTLHEIARICNLQAGLLKMTLSNAHVYNNNSPAVEEYLTSRVYDLPIFSADFQQLIIYSHGPHIPMELNV